MGWPVNVILGTASPFKRDMLTFIEGRFDTRSADIDEQSIRDPDPAVLTRKLAVAKSEALRGGLEWHQTLITADVVLLFNGEIREKPRNADEARQWLHEYAGSSIECVSGVCVYYADTDESVDGFERSVVEFAPSLADAVEDIVAEGTALGCCGAVVFEIPVVARHVVRTYRPDAAALTAAYGPEALAINEELATKSAIVGLPLQLTCDLMARLGVRNFSRQM